MTKRKKQTIRVLCQNYPHKLNEPQQYVQHLSSGNPELQVHDVS